MRNTIARKRGFTLLASAVCTVALFAVAGLAVDIGRMYITKNEAQSYSDAAAVSAAMKLNGTAAGLAAADAAVDASPNSWNFGTTTFNGTVKEYSTDGLTGWATSGSANAATAAFARVTATVNNLPLYLLPVLNAFGGSIANLTTVKASAVAGQVPRAATLFPYSPIAHSINCPSFYASLPAGTLPAGLSTGTPCDTTGNFGFQIGQTYDLRWPSSPVAGASGGNHVPCDGDNATQWINLLTGGPPDYGPICLDATCQNDPASVVGQQIRDDYRPSTAITVGTDLTPKTGTTQTIVSEFNYRTEPDNQTNVAYQPGLTNITANTSYQSYITGSGYTGRRAVTVVVRTGASDISGVLLSPATSQNLAIGFAQFLLLPDGSYGNGGGTQPWCGTYIGSGSLYGVNQGGVPNGGTAVTYVRLTQ